MDLPTDSGPKPTSPEALFDRLLRTDPTVPLLTFYDDSTGERAELSAKSLGNWVAKTHFLLLDALGLTVGEQAAVRLPVHWLAAPILLGSWFAGLEVVSSPSGAVAFTGADQVAGLAADDVYAVSQLSMARPDVPPPGAEDFTSAVRPMPDAWPGVRAQAGPDDPGLDGVSRAGLVAEAMAAAGRLGLGAGGRLLWTGSGTGPADWISWLLAPLAVGGSVVLVRNPDPVRYEQRATSERVTARH